MDQEERQLGSYAVARLSRGSLCGDHDIPQACRRETGEGPLLHGEGEHVGRLGNRPVGFVQPRDLSIIDDQDAQISRRTIQRVQGRVRQLF